METYSVESTNSASYINFAAAAVTKLKHLAVAIGSVRKFEVLFWRCGIEEDGIKVLDHRET